MVPVQQLNVKFIGFWDKDEIIFEHYFKPSHSFLSDKYDLQLNPDKPDVIFASIFGQSHEYTLKHDVPSIMLIHENQKPSHHEFFSMFDHVISFDPDSSLPNHTRIPYWVYRIFDHEYAFDLEKTSIVSSHLINGITPNHWNDKFCAYMHGKPIEYRERMFNELSTYKQVDSGGSLNFNLPFGIEANYMQERLYGVEAHRQKYSFFGQRKFSFCMENSWTEGYTTEKIIDSFLAQTIPLYCGPILESDGFNKKAFLNLYDYDSIDDFKKDVIEIDNSRERENEIRSQPLFSSFPEQFTREAMINLYTKIIGG